MADSEKWEYIVIEIGPGWVRVITSAGHYLKEEDFRAIDEKGKWEKDVWKFSITRDWLLVKLLDKLGGEGWSMAGGLDRDLHDCAVLILQRPA